MAIAPTHRQMPPVKQTSRAVSVRTSTLVTQQGSVTKPAAEQTGIDWRSRDDQRGERARVHSDSYDVGFKLPPKIAMTSRFSLNPGYP